ncbi:MAG: nitroreductase family protein [Myxococcales bacterium]|nr:nitroreductase family protein [Myxococcales bacterium]
MIEELLRSRRSVRRFKPDPVPAEVVERLLDLAVTAPSASNKQPWRFVVVERRATIDEMAAAVRAARARIEAAIPEGSREAVAAYGEYFTRFERAPVVVVPIHRPLPLLSTLADGRLDDADASAVAQMERDSALVGTSLALMNLLLAAHAEGLGASAMTGPLIARAEIARILGVPPGWDIVAVVPLGYPDEVPAATERKSAAKVTRTIR